MNNILEIKNLTKKYPEFALDNISFSLPRGYIMGFIGHNGAGKTTTIKALLNLISIDSGEITLLSQNNKDSEIMEKIGVVMDTPFYVDDWKIKDIPKIFVNFYKNWDQKTFDSLLKKFDLSDNKKISELSRGMKVKLMLSVALSHGAELLILDEPTSGLDPVARDELMEFLCEFIQDDNRSVLFSTHITSDLEKVADFITFISNGKIVYTGSKDELMENFILIKGDYNILLDEQKDLIIGLNKNSFGFEGMIKSSDLNKFSDEFSTEKINLDEIIIYMNKESKKHLSSI